MPARARRPRQLRIRGRQSSARNMTSLSGNDTVPSASPTQAGGHADGWDQDWGGRSRPGSPGARRRRRTRSRGATPTTTGGPSSTRRGPGVPSRPATPATRGTAGRRTPTWWPASGLDNYRFSVEWSRIEPAEGEFSRAALAHYRRQCVGLRERGVDPVVTFHHFTTPRWLTAQGGWETDLAVERFGRFCARRDRGAGRRHGAGLHDQRAEHRGHHGLARRDVPAGQEGRRRCHARWRDPLADGAPGRRRGHPRRRAGRPRRPDPVDDRLPAGARAARRSSRASGTTPKTCSSTRPRATTSSACRSTRAC